MGVRASLPICWLDIEGGVRGVPVWDFAVVIEGAVPRAERLFQFDTHKRAMKLKSSLPEGTVEKMKPGETWHASYTLADGRWECNTPTKAKGSMKAEMQALVPKKCTAAAWNMFGHDAKILREHIDTSSMHLFDPLRYFKKHVNMPSNTLSSNRPGTPRHAMKAGDYSYLGKAHSALVDTLHMRDVTQKIMYAVHNRPLASKLDIDDVHGKEPEQYHEAVVAEMKPAKKPAPGPVEHGEDWMWTSYYWDKQDLRPATSKEFKQKLVAWLESHGVLVNKNMRMAINAARKQATMRRYTEQAWDVVSK